MAYRNQAPVKRCAFPLSGCLDIFPLLCLKKFFGDPKIHLLFQNRGNNQPPEDFAAATDNTTKNEKYLYSTQPIFAKIFAARYKGKMAVNEHKQKYGRPFI
jgi:hypothetical protein